MAKNKFGLRELPEDKNDFTFGALGWRLPQLDMLPAEFELDRPFPIKHQGGTDFCSAYASCAMSEIQEGVELYPPYSFAASKAISGNVEEWGQDLRSAMKAHVKYGAMKAGKTTLVSRVLAEYPAGDKTYLKKSYFQTKGQYDAYDNIRASISKYKDAVEIGVIFSWPLSQYKLDTVAQNGFGHAMYVVGWTEEGLVVVNSYGNEAGKEGVHIMTREVINAFVGRFGAYMMIDIDPEDVKEQADRRLWTLASIYGKIWIKIKNIWS